jgi:hypothetical protein
MSGLQLETCWAFNERWNNKFYYKLHLVGYFYWVVLRCTDPWILNKYITILLLYVFFWVTRRRLNFICRRFGTLRLFRLHRHVGVDWIGLRNVGVFIRENIWLENCLSHWLRQFLSQTVSRINTPTFSNLVNLHVLGNEDGIDKVFRNVGIQISNAKE